MALADTQAGPGTMYRADHVGSLLRPPELLQARADVQAGQLSEDQLHGVEDAAVLKALALQHEAGIDIYTDGEYRRTAWSAALRDEAYADRAALVDDVIGILQQEIDGLVDDGAAYIQIDSLHYVERIADHTIRARMIQEGEDPDRYLDALVAADNRVLEHARGRGVTVAMHMCRGNNRSAWHAEGSYEPIAEKAFQQLKVDRFLLEYDTDRAGGFEPLRFVPNDKTVVLGLISSKEPQLESVDALRRRVDEAARYVPFEHLAISPQCGFASTMLGNWLTWDEQRRKLELVVETACTIWSAS